MLEIEEDLLKEGIGGLVKVLLKQGIKRDYLNWINNNQVVVYQLTHGRLGMSSTVYILGTDDVSDDQQLIQAIIKAAPDQKSTVMTALQKLEQRGEQRGMQQGMQVRELAIAKNMLKLSLDIKLIQEATGLSKETIETLQQE